MLQRPGIETHLVTPMVRRRTAAFVACGRGRSAAPARWAIALAATEAGASAAAAGALRLPCRRQPQPVRRRPGLFGSACAALKKGEVGANERRSLSTPSAVRWTDVASRRWNTRPAARASARRSRGHVVFRREAWRTGSGIARAPKGTMPACFYGGCRRDMAGRSRRTLHALRGDGHADGTSPSWLRRMHPPRFSANGAVGQWAGLARTACPQSDQRLARGSLAT